MLATANSHSRIGTKSELFNQSIDSLRGVGPQLKRRFADIGIKTVQDLLLYFPVHYQDRTRITNIADCVDGQQAQIFGEIIQHQIVYKGKRSLQIRLQDESGLLLLRFFKFYSSQLKTLVEGNRLLVFGKARKTEQGIEMIHPSYQQIEDDSPPPLPDHLTPVYLQRENLKSNMLRKLIQQAINNITENKLKEKYEEILPPTIVDKYSFPPWLDSLIAVHLPGADQPVELLEQRKHPAQCRLAFEELLSHQVSLFQNRLQLKQCHAPAITHQRLLTEKLLRQLPFTLTSAQQRVLGEVEHDLSQSQPMLRLLQGDVGSGKTVIAVFALTCVVKQGFQAVLMAPTEVLAEQHYQSLRNWLQPLGLSPVLLSGQLNNKIKQQRLRELANGDAKIIVGTHALFQEKVSFKRLGLLIIDEQHRFGVKQRQSLMNKGKQSKLMPHQLIMTATPIPRSLAMIAYADLDYSVIDELPPGRLPVTTLVMPESRRDEIINRITHVLDNGRQVYWVCPLIEQSDTLDCQTVENTVNMLNKCLLQSKIDLIHGRMCSEDKDKALMNFKNGHTQILVATTVIEVGVDVPNASLMIIENAERLGLAQLHQLRGRVGRGQEQSSCLMLYKTPLSDLAKQRLDLMRRCHDGFRIAETDLKLRGPGDLLGERQTGALDLKVTDLSVHRPMLADVKRIAKSLVSQTKEVDLLCRRWLSNSNRLTQV